MREEQVGVEMEELGKNKIFQLFDRSFVETDTHLKAIPPNGWKSSLSNASFLSRKARWPETFLKQQRTNYSQNV